MKVMQMRWCNLAVKWARRYTKDWDYFCIATDSYADAYRQSKKDVIDAFEKKHIELLGQDIQHLDAMEKIKLAMENAGTEEVEEVYEDGMHQLSERMFRKRAEENAALPFKDALTAYMKYYDFTDIRVEEKDGIVSFQGMAKKK